MMLCYCVLIGTEKVKVRCYFAHREDYLQSRVENCRNGQIQECFGPGRPRGLKGEKWWYICSCKDDEELFISSFLPRACPPWVQGLKEDHAVLLIVSLAGNL